MPTSSSTQVGISDGSVNSLRSVSSPADQLISALLDGDVQVRHIVCEICCIVSEEFDLV
jgi:hypothetical protein